NHVLATNLITVEVSMDADGTSIGGTASITAFDGLAGSGDHPTAGRITLGRGLDGHGGGWFLHPTPLDNSEFTGRIVNAFTGDAQATSPAAGQTDLFTVVVSELTTIMGITSNPAAHLHTPDNGSRIIDTFIPDDASGGVLGRYFAFDGPSVTHLMT